ncbi:AraC family transcriptional regulator [Enterococcus sp. AZ072]|uniref:AraC family transcriptional regulator n=1 Tax=unclassified Enterococcus TaxID=2608891 RepID=UPI003D295284
MQNYFSHNYYYLEHYSLPYLKGIGYGHASKNYYWDSRKRKDNLIVLQYTLAGTGVFETSDQKIQQHAGSFFLAEVPGDCRYYGQEDWQFVFFEFSKEIIPWFYPVDQSHHKGSECFQQHMLTLVEELRKLPELDFFANTQAAYQLIVALKKELLTKKTEEYPLAEKIKTYLEQHYQEAIGLTDIEEVFQLSKYKSIRLFEQAFDSSPMAYLKRYRVVRSLPLLIEGQRTVDEIAQQVGFSNGNYFAKVFKMELGMTPSDYQKNKQLFTDTAINQK